MYGVKRSLCIFIMSTFIYDFSDGFIHYLQFIIPIGINSKLSDGKTLENMIFPP
jgi:hypothetical protein